MGACHAFGSQRHVYVRAADDPSQLSREEKLALLQRLRDAMKQMHAQLLLLPAEVLLIGFVLSVYCQFSLLLSVWAMLMLLPPLVQCNPLLQQHAPTCSCNAVQAPADRRGDAKPLQDVSNGAHRMNRSAVAVRKQRAGGGGAKRQSAGAKRSRSGGVIAPAPKQ